MTTSRIFTVRRGDFCLCRTHCHQDATRQFTASKSRSLDRSLIALTSIQTRRLTSPQESLHRLMHNLHMTAPHFVRCLIPNERKCPCKYGVPGWLGSGRRSCMHRAAAAIVSRTGCCAAIAWRVAFSCFSAIRRAVALRGLCAIHGRTNQTKTLLWTLSAVVNFPLCLFLLCFSVPEFSAFNFLLCFVGRIWLFLICPLCPTRLLFIRKRLCARNH